MPVRRRLRKRGTGGRLSDVQRLHLRRGDVFGLGSAFPDDDAEREAWAAHRNAVLQEHIEQEPGSRPYAWWRYSSPQPRDDQIHETSQLRELGLIGAAELEALKVQWRHWERIARVPGGRVRRVAGVGRDPALVPRVRARHRSN